MKKMLLLILIAFMAVQCKKEKYCYTCTTISERTYNDGKIEKDTFAGRLCNDESFIKAYIKNGTYNGPNFEVIDGDTVRFDLVMFTMCKKN